MATFSFFFFQICTEWIPAKQEQISDIKWLSSIKKHSVKSWPLFLSSFSKSVLNGFLLNENKFQLIKSLSSIKKHSLKSWPHFLSSFSKSVLNEFLLNENKFQRIKSLSSIKKHSVKSWPHFSLLFPHLSWMKFLLKQKTDFYNFFAFSKFFTEWIPAKKKTHRFLLFRICFDFWSMMGCGCVCVCVCFN